MNAYIYEEQVLQLNKQAIEEIKQENYEKSLNLLKKSLITVKKIQTEPNKSRILTQLFNTLGNLFKKTSNLNESIKFFLKSVELERNLPEEHKGYIALACLNLCTLYSQASDHQKSIKFGTQAINLLKRLVRLAPKLQNSLIIAYYNLGNEYKFIGQLPKAEELLIISQDLSTKLFGAGHELTQTIARALKGIPTVSQERNLKKTQKFIRRSMDEGSGTKLPEIFKKRSTSDDKGYYKDLYMKQFQRNEVNRDDGIASFTFYKEEKKKGKKKLNKTPLSEDYEGEGGGDEERSTKTDKSISVNGRYRKFDVSKHKNTERAAAVSIQSWWRGILGRRRCAELRVEYDLKLAENKAKNAIKEYEKMKMRANKLKKQKILK